MTFSSAAILQQPPAPLPMEPRTQAGAYALVFDAANRVLTVRPANGRCYLPGGRIEAGETPRQALAREIAEECAWSAAILSPVRQSAQSIMDGAVLLNASHWRARLVGELGTAPEHRCEWLPPSEALECLHREADRAALRAALRRGRSRIS